MVFPTTSATWTVNDFSGFDGTTLNKAVPVPKVCPYECLVRIEAASVNFRDIMIAEVGPAIRLGPVVPGSDGAGVVIAVGEKVTRFQENDRVYTITHTEYLAGDLDDRASKTSLGGSLDGCFRQYGTFPEWGLVAMPDSLDYREAASLPAAGITAWNALYGLSGKAVKAGDTVLTQGTGGVSIFAVQFALAAGATVIATTSNDAKADKLRGLGVQHVINYNDDRAWGHTAKLLTEHRRGVDFVVEIGGPATLEQSLSSVRKGGIIAVCGAIGGFDQAQPGPPLISAWTSSCIVRGVAVGSRAHAEDMNRASIAMRVRPVLDMKSFALKELKDAYQYLKSQKHFGKVVIDCQR
ncbi:Zinc-binding dehydrogenase-like protein 22 [Elsinoe fawcettii]|nr:Zinc-binding dehydrogenase-like protein 22 [Elsinoe fawcettii]